MKIPPTKVHQHLHTIAAVLCFLAIIIVIDLLTACSHLPKPVKSDFEGRHVAISWAHPTKREDGSDLPADNISTYEIYQATNEQMTDVRYFATVDEPPIAAQEVMVYPGVNCFTMMTTDIHHAASVQSAPACVTIEPLNPPDPPDPNPDPDPLPEIPPPTSFLIPIDETPPKEGDVLYRMDR